MARLGVYQENVINQAGEPVADVVVTVADAVTAATPTLYSDAAGTTPIAGDLLTDSNGFVEFYVTAGFYDITFTGTTGASTRENVAIGTLQGYDYGAEIAVDLSSGNATVSGRGDRVVMTGTMSAHVTVKLAAGEAGQVRELVMKGTLGANTLTITGAADETLLSAVSEDTTTRYRWTGSAWSLIGTYFNATLPGAASDGRAIYEADPVADASKQFAAGGTFTLDASNPRHRYLKVHDSSTPLTANMTVDLNMTTSEPWRPGDKVTVIKGDQSAFNVSVFGFDLDGEGTWTLSNYRDSIECVVQNQDAIGSPGPGPGGIKFERGQQSRPFSAVPDQVSSAERTAGTETALRSFSPNDIAYMAGQFGSDLFEVNQRIDAVEERVIPQGTLALAITDGNGQANIASPDNDTLILTPGAGVDDPYTARSVARLATAQYTDILATASRVLSGSDRTIITSTPEGEASRQLHQRIVARHGSNLATEIVFTIPESLPTGPYLFFRAPDQAGDVSIVLGGAGTLRGVEHNDPELPTVSLMPGQMLCLWVTNYGSYPQVSLMFSSEDRAIPSPTLDGVAPNDVVTFKRHAGMVVQASGNVEVLGTDIPSGQVAFPITILATASINVTFNSAATALAPGDMIAAYVYSPTVWKAKKIAAGDFL